MRRRCSFVSIPKLVFRTRGMRLTGGRLGGDDEEGEWVAGVDRVESAAVVVMQSIYKEMSVGYKETPAESRAGEWEL